MHRLSNLGGFVRFALNQPKIMVMLRYVPNINIMLLTFLRRPRSKTGNDFILSERDNWALAAEPAAVMLAL